MKHASIFAATFLLGALVTLAARTARHDPHAAHAAAPAAHASPPAAPSAAAPATATPAPQTAAPVNTLCAICGMQVDPKLPTLEYKGQRIGFGCRMCPPKFKAEPDKYGPYYLRNELMPK